MIQTGESISAHKLRQSFQEVCDSYDIQKYINPKRVKIEIDANARFPFELTPTSYAEICTKEYGNPLSSAIELDWQLKKRKYRTTYSFSYKYNTGELAPDAIVFDAYCLDWFYQVYLTAVPREKYKDTYINAINDAWHLSYYYAQYLWAQNPWACRNIATALREPEFNQWEQIIGAILGIGFHFHPLDVYEFAIEHINPNLSQGQREEHRNEQQNFKDLIMQKYGINTRCLVLSPQNRDKLTKILTKTDTPYVWQLLQNILCITR